MGYNERGGKLVHTLSKPSKDTIMTFNSNGCLILSVRYTEEFKIVHSIKYPAPVLSIGLSSDDTT
jgi:U3 small nucleolar RNA-associated protein 15